MEALGLDCLEDALVALQVNYDVILEQQYAEQLFSLKAMDPKEYPRKSAKGFVA